jgi:1-acyl-sn-glycerol-3-phosphate acyltransferase
MRGIVRGAVAQFAETMAGYPLETRTSFPKAAMMRHALRRLVMVPFMFALTAVILVLLPVVAVGQAIAALGVLRGHPPRWRVLRIAAFATAYTTCECLCLMACLLLWLASPVPRWRDDQRWQARHVRLLGIFLETLLRAAEVVMPLRLKLESPRGEVVEPDRPLIVLGRHAGPGASLVLVHVLLQIRERVPKIVLKEQLRLDPSFDVLLTRIGCVFIGRSGSAAAAAAAAVATLASHLDPDDALVLFPEGSDWTPTRHRLAVRRLRRKGLTAQADAAARMPYVLPPRPGGAFAALRAAPTAQVAVFMHSGHDDLLDAASVWRALPLQRELHMVWWNEPRPELASEQECATWLNGIWAGIDAWIQEQAAVAELMQDPAGT